MRGAFGINEKDLPLPAADGGADHEVKTYTVAPDVDAQTLIEEPFQLEGFLYTYADIVKAENPVAERQSHTETVTVETAKKNLDVILEQLAPTMEYDDGTWSGTLALDHTSIQTQAAGYTTGSSTVTATKTIGPLDRNDMSYVPATTVKNGVTLNLASVDWQVIGADLVGDVMAPCSYQAVATYREILLQCRYWVRHHRKLCGRGHP